jgi:hypothetical protein
MTEEVDFETDKIAEYILVQIESGRTDDLEIVHTFIHENHDKVIEIQSKICKL